MTYSNFNIFRKLKQFYYYSVHWTRKCSSNLPPAYFNFIYKFWAKVTEYPQGIYYKIPAHIHPLRIRSRYIRTWCICITCEDRTSRDRRSSHVIRSRATRPVLGHFRPRSAGLGRQRRPALSVRDEPSCRASVARALAVICTRIRRKNVTVSVNGDPHLRDAQRVVHCSSLVKTWDRREEYFLPSESSIFATRTSWHKRLRMSRDWFWIRKSGGKNIISNGETVVCCEIFCHRFSVKFEWGSDRVHLLWIATCRCVECMIRWRNN